MSRDSLIAKAMDPNRFLTSFRPHDVVTCLCPVLFNLTLFWVIRLYAHEYFLIPTLTKLSPLLVYAAFMLVHPMYCYEHGHGNNLIGRFLMDCLTTFLFMILLELLQVLHFRTASLPYNADQTLFLILLVLIPALLVNQILISVIKYIVRKFI
jgi:hypothetical protein